MYRLSRLVSLQKALAASTAIATRPVLQLNDTQIANIDFKLGQQLAAVQMQCAMPETRKHPTLVLQRAVDQLHCTDASSEGGARSQYLRGLCCA